MGNKNQKNVSEPLSYFQVEGILRQSVKDSELKTFENLLNKNKFEEDHVWQFVLTQKASKEIVSIVCEKYGTDHLLEVGANKSSLLTFGIRKFVNLHVIQLLIDKGLDVNFKEYPHERSQNYYGLMADVYTPLIAALVVGSRFEIIEMLIKAGADPNLQIQGSDIGSPLHAAIQNPSLKAIKFLVKSGANFKVDLKNFAGFLNFAIDKNLSNDIIEYLADNAFEYSIGEKNHPLKSCLSVRSKKIVMDYIFSKTTDFGWKDNRLNTFLHFSAAQNRLEITKLLLEKGVDISSENRQKDTPLLVACSENHTFQTIEYLLENGADPNHANINSETALHKTTTSFTMNVQIIKLLIAAGADIKRKNSYNSTFLHSILVGSNTNKIQTLMKLLEDKEIKEIINDQNNEGDTPLLCACRLVDFPTIERLIKLGADPKIKNFANKTVLELLLENHRNIDLSNILKLFIDSGCDLNNKTEGAKSLLVFAIDEGIHFKTIEFIVNSGIDIQSIKIDNENILFYILRNRAKNREEIISLLLKRGIEVNCCNHHLNTPLHFACASKVDIEILKVMINSGANLFAANKDNSTPLDFCTKELKTELLNYTSYVEDFKTLFERAEMTDGEIKDIKFHKLLVQTRIGGKEEYESLMKNLLMFPEEEIKLFLKWIYCGHIFQGIEEMFQKLQIKKEFDKINGLENIIIDFKKLYSDESTKDFSIIVDNTPIKVHKWILMARSNLFRGMFLSVTDESTQVNDYTGKSIKTIKSLIYYLYTDSVIEEDIDEDALDELLDAVEYYQLSVKSSLPYILARIDNTIQKSKKNSKTRFFFK
ncbi:ada2a-containing complex component 3 [Anaeramoeba flamelloides]|uniref:Ada2a-containing complex component 3 n=1 Tax=Anaeramoeba flamelloides TaxID=1746091 RepID=A0ABQ8YVN1_9EUKA|nr:ada2a-containing complex component 3 [Anaeramoeba flamelloides]